MNIIRRLLGLAPRLRRRDLKQCYTGQEGLLSYKERLRIHKHFKQNHKGSIVWIKSGRVKGRLNS